MLTNAYYYNVYQPYILSNTRRASSLGANRSILRTNEGTMTRVTKNNAVKTDILEYVDGLCKNVTEIKDCAKYVTLGAERYYENVLNDGFESVKDWAFEDLSMLCNAYNSAMRFGLKQEVSLGVANYIEDIKDIANSHSEEFLDAGITLLNDGEIMSFRPETFETLDYLDFGAALSKAAQGALEIYDRTVAIMQKPVYEYMNPRQLSNYYNYKIAMDASAFNANPTPKREFVPLYSGFILDRAI